MQVLDTRTLGGFPDLFMSLELSERLIGLGSHFRETMAGFTNVVASDWRGFVIKNGYISLVTLTAAFVLQCIVFPKSSWRAIMLLFAIIIGHRASMASSIWFPLLMVTSSFLRRPASINRGRRNGSSASLQGGVAPQARQKFV